jgi:translation initiation factor IF-1
MSKFHPTKKKHLPIIIGLIILGLGFFYSNGIKANTLSVSQNNQNSAPILDYVAINNEVVDKTQSNRVHVTEGDAVKIAGQAQPGAKITIIFGERQLETTVDQYGNWFVLFSVLNLEDGFYNIQAKLEKNENFSSLETQNDTNEQEVTLSTLSLGEDFAEIEPEDENNKLFATQTNWLSKIKTKQLVTYLIVTVIIVGLIIGGVILSKNEKVVNKIEEIKQKFIKRQND